MQGMLMPFHVIKWNAKPHIQSECAIVGSYAYGKHQIE